MKRLPGVFLAVAMVDGWATSALAQTASTTTKPSMGLVKSRDVSSEDRRKVDAGFPGLSGREIRHVIVIGRSETGLRRSPYFRLGTAMA